MAELIEDGASGGLVLADGAPFDGEGKTLTVTKQVNVAQLLEEIYDRLGDRQHYDVVISQDRWGEPISETNPGVVHVRPATVDMRTVRGAVESHTPDAHWGMTDAEVEIHDLKTRLASEDLGAEDLNKLLRSIFA